MSLRNKEYQALIRQISSTTLKGPLQKKLLSEHGSAEQQQKRVSNYLDDLRVEVAKDPVLRKEYKDFILNLISLVKTEEIPTWSQKFVR